MSENTDGEENPTELESVFGFLDANAHIESDVEVRAVPDGGHLKMRMGDEVRFWLYLDLDQSRQLLDELGAAISECEAEPAE